MNRKKPLTLSGKIFRAILIFLAALLIGAAVYLNSLLPIITGYAAKNLCSGVFVSGRSQEDVESVDLNFSFIKLNKNRVDYDDRSVTSRFLWGKSKAIYRDGFGSTLVRGVKESELRSITFPALPDPGYDSDTTGWPLGNILPADDSSTAYVALNQISEELVDKDAYGGNAFAFMVVHKGKPVAERYKPRFNASTRFLSWSMAKSFTNALVGVMTLEDGLDIYKPAGIDLWASDDRSNITLNNLMQMQSGLSWNEDYGNRSDVTLMLHCTDDFARFAYDQPLDTVPGTRWYYSSGTANILSYILRKRIGDDQDYYRFPYTDLFYRIGITDAVFEVDASGTYVGSSYLYATARDYARFAMLYMQDGVFNGNRILPEGWVAYSTDEAPMSSGAYGSLFWLNEGGELPSAPSDTYMCIGHDGQRIFMIPSKELIIVVLGYSPSGSMDFNSLVGDIIKSLN